MNFLKTEETPFQENKNKSVQFEPTDRKGLFSDKKGWRRYIGPKRIFLLLMLIVLFVTAWYLRQQGLLDPEKIGAILEESPATSVGIFVLIYVISVMTTLPTLPLNLAAGLFWGPIAGAFVATAGSGLGAIGAFFIARLILGQPLAQRFDNKLISYLQNEYTSKGWRFIAFVRINPVFPTGPLNYFFGLSSVNPSTYTWATLAFIFPPTLAFSIIGHQAGSFIIQGETADLIKTILSISLAITLLFLIKYGTKFLNQKPQKQL